ncbi:ras-related protein Rab-13-like [Sycon ciliatum]|uniref:ras-related protein Rab-13-like n=1 Tax=Sycon ciliatum TaxID=27933 RepID=UPI0031F64EE9
MADHGFEVLYKILVIGNSGVGKTSVMMRYVDQQFKPSMLSTVGVDFKTKVILCKGQRIKLQIWDTAGHERFRTITGAFYRGAMGILLVYDITDSASFAETSQWLNNIKEKCAPEDDPVVFLVGNKCDLKDQRRVSTTDGEKLAKTYGILFAETSAAEYTNISETFAKLTEVIMDRDKLAASVSVAAQLGDEKKTDVHTLDDEDSVPQRRKSCCK